MCRRRAFQASKAVDERRLDETWGQFMRVVELSQCMKNGVVRLSATAERDGDGPSRQLYFEFKVPDPVAIDDSADPIAAALLIAAMRVGEVLEIEQPISPRLHFNLPRICNIFHTWWPERFSRIEIKTSPRRGPPPIAQARAATFFRRRRFILQPVKVSAAGGDDRHPSYKFDLHAGNRNAFGEVPWRGR